MSQGATPGKAGMNVQQAQETVRQAATNVAQSIRDASAADTDWRFFRRTALACGMAAGTTLVVLVVKKATGL